MQAIKRFLSRFEVLENSPRPSRARASVEPDCSLVAATTFSWFRRVHSTFSSCNPLLNVETHANHESGYVMANESRGAPWSGKRPAPKIDPMLKGC